MAEVEIDGAEDGESTEDEGGFGAEIGFVGIEDEGECEGPAGLWGLLAVVPVVRDIVSTYKKCVLEC